MTEQDPVIENPAGLLAAYDKLKEEVRTISAERDELAKAKETLETAAKDDAWRSRALLAETKAALQAQGIKDADRLMPFVGTEGLDFDADGKLTGLDERMTDLKKNLPEVFDAKRRAGGKADIFGTEPVEAKVDPLRAAVHKAIAG